MDKKLLLLVVAHHPVEEEVLRLKSCLNALPSHIAYAVAANDYKSGESVDLLEDNSEYFLRIHDNVGYGRAVNALFFKSNLSAPFVGILNTDLSWHSGTFEVILEFLLNNDDVSLLTPRILGELGDVQLLCKQSPTVLAMFSRRFIPNSLKPSWLKGYDLRYCMHEYDYSSIFEVPYLSGCCMVARSSSFEAVGGFDEKFFLYLEDADLTRSMSS